MTPFRSIAVLLVITSLGCSRHRPVKIHTENLLRITYNSTECERLVDGRIKCKNVIFTEKSVSVTDLQK